MAKCTFCGRENSAEVELCGGCGAKILDRDRQTTAAEPAPDGDSGKADSALVGQVLKELQTGGKIAAIKLYREQTGVGLKDAKDAVEALGAKHGIVATRSGCAGVLLVLLLAGGTLAAVL